MAAQNTSTGDNGVGFIRALADFLNDFADKADGGKGAVSEAPFEETEPGEPAKVDAKKTTARKTAASAKTKAAAEEKADDADPRAVREAELKKARITSLKKIAKEAGFEPEDIEGAEKADLIEALLDDEFPGDDDADDASDEGSNEDDDDAADEAAEYTEATLKKMNLKELRRIAVEVGAEKEDVEDADKADIIEFILEESGSDGDEGDDDEEDAYLTEADLKKMDLKELKVTAKEYGVKFPLSVKKPALIDLILANGDDDGE